MKTIDSLRFPRLARRTVWWAVALACAAAPLPAQNGEQSGAGPLTREQLEAQAAAAEREQRTEDAAALRERLRDGDFKVGDRIVVTVQGETFLSDTFTVRAGQVVSFPNIPDISLRGVLRAELTDHLTREFGRYVRNPTVRATSLIRVAVLGEVGQPGFYSVPADFLPSDVIMAAGGPTALADMDKAEVRRGNTVILDRKEMQVAIKNGVTLDQLDVRPGDELVIGQARKVDWWVVARVTGAVLGVVTTIIALSR